MKTIKMIFLALILLSGFSAAAQDYKSDMDTLVKSLRVRNPNYPLLASQFQSIAQSNPEQWEPAYYFAYCKVMQGYNEKGEAIDKTLDEAEPVILAWEKKLPNESEFIVVEAMLNQARIAVAPMARGMKYSQKYNQLLEKAIAMNPENPRAYLIKGMGTLYMPEMFGGGKKNAQPLFFKAKEKFESFKSPSEFYPYWGKEWNEAMISQVAQ